MSLRVVITVLILVMLPLTVFVVLQKTGLLNFAAESSQTGTIELFLSAPTNSLEVGDESFVDIKINTNGLEVSIIQVNLMYTYEGEKPPIEVLDSQERTFTQIRPADIPQLNFITNDVTDNATPGTNAHQVIIRLDAIIADDATPFSTENEVVLGTIHFKANLPTPELNLIFEKDLTSITLFDTGQNVNMSSTEGITVTPTMSSFTIIGTAQLDPPKISSIYPLRGVTGNTVVVEGENFGEEQLDGSVNFGKITAEEIKSWNTNSLTVLVPEGAVTGKISVTTSGGTALSSDTFEISNQNADAPKIESFLPKTGTAGTPVTIIGTNFGTSQLLSKLSLGNVEITDVTAWSNVLIEARLPANAVTGLMSVTTSEGVALADECLIVTGTVSTSPSCNSADLTIGDVGVFNVNSNSATITWTTETESSSKILYGINDSYGTQTEEVDLDPMVTNHSVQLNELSECKTYHFQIQATDSKEETSVSADNEFTTEGCVGGAEIVSQTNSTLDPSTGGTLNLTEGGESLTLQAPSNFSTGETIFQMKKLNSDDVEREVGTPANKVTVGGNIYELDAYTTGEQNVSSFTNPLVVTVAYNALDVQDINEGDLKIHRWDGQAWVALSDCVVNSAERTVTCTTTQFSTYGLFGESQTANQTTEETPGDTTESGGASAAGTSTDSGNGSTGSSSESTEAPQGGLGEQPESTTSGSSSESSSSSQPSIPVTGTTEYTSLLSLVGLVLVILGLALPTAVFFVKWRRKD